MKLCCVEAFIFVHAIMADSLGVSAFPASAGNKLDIQWGVGREMLLVDVGSADTEESVFGSAQWQAYAAKKRSVLSHLSVF